MIQSRVDRGILTLSIDRPDKKNALTSEMYLRLAEQLNQAQDNEAVRVILLRGNGEAFCAGNDLADFLGLAQSGALSDDLTSFPPMGLLHSLVDNSIPLVAAVQGPAVGIGFTMLLHCDLVICAENALFQAPFVDLGLVPEGGSSLLLPEKVGRVNTAEILLLGAPLSAHRALQMGLCNKICSAEELEATALMLAQALANKPAKALAASKKMLQGDTEKLHQRIDEEAVRFLAALQSEEAKKALSQFFQN